eukprot:TRINITY_DN20083_c0_g1_i1.p1 TRINITY_DN20083_c0_g1~~TRINITY_DN20083_c0_g1_i1.p1  ORF type:complete len:397 (+),score=93.14 TRINITY_DN20083_c0_g1_i1:100-1290(+)
MPRSSSIPAALHMRDLAAVASLPPKSTQPYVLPTSPRGLVGDLNFTLTRSELTEASEHARVAEAERAHLVDQLAVVEAEERKTRREVNELRQRNFDASRENDDLLTREHAAKYELSLSHDREKELAMLTIKSQLAASEAENEKLSALSGNRSYMHEVKKLYTALQARTLEVDTLKRELTHAYSENQGNLVKIECLQSDNGMLRKDFERAREGEAFATRSLRELEQRVASLEEVLRTAKQKQAESVSEMEVAQAQSLRLFEANRLLRLDLQQSIEQVTRAHEAPFYSASLVSVGEPAPACVEDIASFRREIQERERRLDREIDPASVPAERDLVIPSTSASAYKAVLPRAPAYSVKPPLGSAPLHRQARWRALDARAVSFAEVDRLGTSLSSARSYA